jgi:hypothetical protein
MAEQSRGWSEHEKMVLDQLKTLSSNVYNLSEEMHGIRRDIVRMEEREKKVNELKEWKEKMNSVISPEQFATHLIEYKATRDFTIKATMTFTVIQFLFASAVVFSKFF